MAAETPERPHHYWTVEDAWALVEKCRGALTPEELQWPLEGPERPKLTLIPGGKKP